MPDRTIGGPDPDVNGVAELEAAREPYGAEWPPSLSGNDLDLPGDWS